MKNFIIALVLSLSASSFCLADCNSGSCNVGPLKRVGSKVVTVTREVVRVPVNVTRRVVRLPARVRAHRACR